jgi:hypothetical protein
MIILFSCRQFAGSKALCILFPFFSMRPNPLSAQCSGLSGANLIALLKASKIDEVSVARCLPDNRYFISPHPA